MLVTSLIIGAMVAALVLMQINLRLGSPVVAIAERWLRWIILSFGGALVCREWNIIDRPYWVLALALFVGWFLVETLYNWLAISAHSLSALPLFPRYSVNATGEEWPVQPRLLRAREWLRAEGFRQVQALKAEIGSGVFLRVSVYHDAQALLRVQVTFIPQGNGSVSVCYAVTTVTADGARYLTDNLHIPFGGFYPENWFVDRQPWCRSLSKLIVRHRARLGRAGVTGVPFTTEPLADFNAVQRELDQINTELGFLHPAGKREDHGKFTYEGRYRVWKEIWTLNYLGRSARYE